MYWCEQYRSIDYVIALTLPHSPWNSISYLWRNHAFHKSFFPYLNFHLSLRHTVSRVILSWCWTFNGLAIVTVGFFLFEFDAMCRVCCNMSSRVLCDNNEKYLVPISIMTLHREKHSKNMRRWEANSHRRTDKCWTWRITPSHCTCFTPAILFCVRNSIYIEIP